MSTDCTVDKVVDDTYKKLRFAKVDHCLAMILKINAKTMVVELEEYMEDQPTLETVKEELEEQSPRFIIFSYRWARGDQYGGRIQFPIVFIYFSPEGANPHVNMLYSRMKQSLITKFSIQRSYEVRELDDDVMTEKWLLERLESNK